MKASTVAQTWRDLSYQQLALCLIRQGQREKLLALGAQAGQGELPYYLALHLALAGDYSGALENLRPLASQGHEGARHLVFQLLLHQARVCAQGQDFEALSQLLEEAFKIMPPRGEAPSALRRFRGILPYLYLKAGRRREAADLWLKEIWHLGGEALHNLALLYYHWAIHTEERLTSGAGEAKEEVEELWTRAIAFWVALAVSEDFLAEWSQRRRGCYGTVPDRRDLAELQKHILEEMLSATFRRYIDKYSEAGQETQADRHRRYLSLVKWEKQAATLWQKLLRRPSWLQRFPALDFSRAAPLQAAVRAVQRARGHEPCFQGPPREHCPGCAWEPLCRGPHPKGAEALLPAEFFGGPLLAGILPLGPFLKEVIHLQAEVGGCEEEVQLLADYFSPFGLALVLLEERLPEQVLRELEALPPDLQGSPLRLYLEAAAWAEKGRRWENQKLSQALDAWEKAGTLITKLKKGGLSRRIKKRQEQLEEDLAQWVSESCIREARNLQRAGKLPEAIALLERGLKIAATEDLRVQLADFYCEAGRVHLEKENFQAAREEFEKALKVKPGYVKARDGMSTSYNNEGVCHHNAGRFDEAIRLQRKALEYNPNNHTSRKNLAGSLNAKAVRMVNEEFERIDFLGGRLAILLKALEILGEALEYDPTDESIIKNYNDLLRFLRMMGEAYAKGSL